MQAKLTVLIKPCNVRIAHDKVIGPIQNVPHPRLMCEGSVRSIVYPSDTVRGVAPPEQHTSSEGQGGASGHVLVPVDGVISCDDDHHHCDIAKRHPVRVLWVETGPVKMILDPLRIMTVS